MKQKYKRYVDIVAKIDKKGDCVPIFLLWESAHGFAKYKIDKILGIREAFSIVGGCGLEYRCVIDGKIRNLYLEKDNRWFLESEKP